MKNWRINLILFIILLFGATIIGRLIFIQIINQEYWQALARGQQKFFTALSPDRGEVFLKDKDNNLYSLAINREWDFVYAAPNEIEKKEEVAEILGQILNLDDIKPESVAAKDFILDKIKEESFYEIIKDKLADHEIDEIRRINLPGVYLAKSTGRFYPQGKLASQVIGFLGGDGKGQYGIEEYYNEILAGKEGFQEGERSPKGFFLPFSESFSPAQKGENIILTIDYNIQFFAEKLLEKAKKDLEIEEGQIIVMDPNSGKILALANFPNFDPNKYSEIKDMEVFQNGAIQKFFEPGSVFKPITMAAALENGKITPDTTYVDEGFVKVGGSTIYNYNGGKWGQKTMTEVLEKSINTGAVFAERQLGNELFLEYIQKFGFFEPTKIDLNGEVFSENKEFKKGYEINFVTASFGQGIEITPMQLARGISVIANGGKLVQPYIVENSPLHSESPQEQRQVISSKTASELTSMLVSVVENGFANRGKIPGYFIAGKTGTAQVPWAALGIEKSGYSDKTIQTFAGFGPVSNPKFLIVVKLNNPRASTAEYSATPMFRELAKYIIDYYQIPPDYEE